MSVGASGSSTPPVFGKSGNAAPPGQFSLVVSVEPISSVELCPCGRGGCEPACLLHFISEELSKVGANVKEDSKILARNRV